MNTKEALERVHIWYAVVQEHHIVNLPEDIEALAHLTKLAEENERLRPILDERDRQDKKWGVQNHGPMTWLAILSEEVGEASKAVLEGNAEGYKKELTQVAAVVVAMLECFKRGDASLVSVKEIQQENAALKHIIDCANTPLMADVLKERDALKVENDKLITEVSHLQHDLFYEKQGRETAEAELSKWKPVIEVAGRVDKELAIRTLRRLYHPMFQEKGRPVSVQIFDTIMPLLEAIRDPTREKPGTISKQEERND